MAESAPLLSLDEALARLLAVAAQRPPLEIESLDTFDALGRVLAQGVVSAIDVPGHDNSQMDGYALRVADLAAAGGVLPVAQRIAAGQVGRPLAPCTAARIFTGAPIPVGADAVVMQEQTEPVQPAGSVPGNAGESGQGAIRVMATPAPGDWIRRQGEDIRAGSEVLSAGRRLDAAALGLAASVGAATLHVRRRPRVALFSTGDELTMPGQPLKPGGIYNSNRYTLRGLLQAAGCEVRDLGIVPDRLDATRAALREAARSSDLIVTSGGVSMGEEDHLRPALLAEGRLDLWQIAMKPGKPLAFGAVRRVTGEYGAEARDDAGQGPAGGLGAAAVAEALYIGLPGNPVSSFVTFLVAVAPVLRVLQGMPGALPPALPARADFDWPRADRRREFLRVRFNATGGLDLFPNQSSGVLTSAAWADGLVDNPAGATIARGDMVRLLPLARLIGA